MKPLMLVAAVGLVALSGCGRRDSDDRESGVSVSMEHDGDAAARAGTGSTKLSLSLPGGFNAKIDLPGSISGKGKFDIDGVGLYPGAAVNLVDVNAAAKGERSVVKVGFVAPDGPAAVGDWYEKQFAEKQVTASRAGQVFTGKSDDGDDFTLDLAADSAGQTRGTLTIIDADKG